MNIPPDPVSHGNIAYVLLMADMVILFVSHEN